eukprot:jgi/Chlat1/7512/Chrsp61S07010
MGEGEQQQAGGAGPGAGGPEAGAAGSDGVGASSSTSTSSRVPVTVLTGYLGAGKTTVVRHLVVWIKNEFGDMQIDSEVARESNIAVQEILNGCLCCVLVGQLGSALLEVATQEPAPARIIVETSGSAYPAPLAWEVQKHESVLRLDGIVTVIDVLNFKGYDDKSSTAKLQAKYTDLLLINKHELVSERQLDDVLDDVYELNPDTPMVRTDKGRVSADLVFGLDTQLSRYTLLSEHQDVDHHAREVDVLQVFDRSSSTQELDEANFMNSLKALPADEVYRAKGLVKFKGYDDSGHDVGANDNKQQSFHLFNLVGGRLTLEPLSVYDGAMKAVFMGSNLKRHLDAIAVAVQASKEDITLTEAHS